MLNRRNVLRIFCAFGLGLALLPGMAHAQTTSSVLVTKQGYAAVDQYDLDGNYITHLFTGPLQSPFGVALNNNDSMYYVSDYQLGTVERFQADGTYVDTFISGLNQPMGIVFDASGNLHVREYGNGNYTLVDPGGSPSLLHNYMEEAHYVRWAKDGNGNPTLHSNGGGDYYYWESGAPGSITWSHHVKFADWAGGLEFDDAGAIPGQGSMFTGDRYDDGLGAGVVGELRRWTVQPGDGMAIDEGRFADLGASAQPGEVLLVPDNKNFYVSDWASDNIYIVDGGGGGVLNTFAAPGAGMNWGLAIGPQIPVAGASAPEPGTLALAGFGLAGLGMKRRRK